MKNTHTSSDPKYIDPMDDFGFKKIFRDSGKKQFLIRPLNAIFGLDIADIEFRESEHLGDTPRDRNARFDLHCTASDGAHFIVEVQLASQKYFLERALYYATFPIRDEAQKGMGRAGKKGAAWDFYYPPVFFLGLLNFDFRELAGHEEQDYGDQFIHRFSLRDDQTGERMTESLRFAFLEIRRFDKAKEDCTGFEDQFLYMMKNIPIFAKEPALWEEDPYFGELLAEAEFARMSKAEQAEYKKRLKMGDYQNQIDYAVERGMKKGRAEEQQAIARRMLAAGLPMDVVAECTGMSEEQIRQLSASPALDRMPDRKPDRPAAA